MKLRAGIFGCRLDGWAAGSSMFAAIEAIRAQNPEKIIAAIPVAPQDTCEQMNEKAEEMICLLTPEPFYGAGLWYEGFSQTSEEEVTDLFAQAISYKQTMRNGVIFCIGKAVGIGSKNQEDTLAVLDLAPQDGLLTGP